MSAPQKILKPYSGPIGPSFSIHYCGSGPGFPEDYRFAVSRVFADVSAEGAEEDAKSDDVATMKRHPDCLVFPTGVLGSA